MDAAAKWPFVVLGGVVCLAGGCTGAGLGWLGAALYQMDLGGPQVSPGNLAGTLWGAGGGVLAGLAWSAAMVLPVRRGIRRTDRPFSAGRLTFLGLVLGCAAGALGTAVLHGALTLVVFPARREPALWFLGLLVGIPAGGMGGLVAGLACAGLVKVLRPPTSESRVDTIA